MKDFFVDDRNIILRRINFCGSSKTAAFYGILSALGQNSTLVYSAIMSSF